MLDVSIVANREILTAQIAPQKMFVMLKLRPNRSISQSTPATNFVFLIDTSGSMYEVVSGETNPTGKVYQIDGKTYQQVKGGKSKMDLVIDSLKTLVDSGQLQPSDRIAIVKFDDQSATLIPLTSAIEKDKLIDAIESLKKFSGGTYLGKGMQESLQLLSSQTMSSRRVLIFTDGMTFDEEFSQELARKFASENIPITALGVGNYQEDLLIYLGEVTGGRLFHITTEENNSELAISIDKLPQKIIEEFSQAQQDVVTNLHLHCKTVQGVELTRIARVYPEPAEFDLIVQPYSIGNASANDETIFILEFNITNRPAAKVRIAQLGLTYDVPGKNQKGEFPPQNLVVQFVNGEFDVSFNEEVMGYLQQLNTVGLIKQATQLAQNDPAKATELLEAAKRLTLRIGNETMRKTISLAQDELRKTCKISDATRKTIKMGSRGKTILIDEQQDDSLSEETIRQISET